MFGDVGTGKTMLMDMLYASIDTNLKKRVHFHSFMLDIHAGSHKLLQSKTDPLPVLATEIAKDAKLLCFDEFQVTDIVDAMILRGLLQELFKRGVVIVCTSNRHPDALFLNGIQRQSFIPCIELIKINCLQQDLNSGKDYRKIWRESHIAYFHPLNSSTSDKINLVYKELVGVELESPRTLHVLGRPMHVKHQSTKASVARFTFADLCEKPLSAADYLEIVKHYKTVIVEQVPTLNLNQYNEARRFITLVDALYENKTKVIISADAEINGIFSVKAIDSLSTSDTSKNRPIYAGVEEVFAFQRCVSRLVQMQSKDWFEGET